MRRGSRPRNHGQDQPDERRIEHLWYSGTTAVGGCRHAAAVEAPRSRVHAPMATQRSRCRSYRTSLHWPLRPRSAVVIATFCRRPPPAGWRGGDGAACTAAFCLASPSSISPLSNARAKTATTGAAPCDNTPYRDAAVSYSDHRVWHSIGGLIRGASTEVQGRSLSCASRPAERRASSAVRAIIPPPAVGCFQPP
jgi:hypothetical protein